MKIDKVQSYNLNFRNDPVVNAKLINKLSTAKKYKVFCNEVKELCQTMNRIELELREAEEGKKSLLSNKLADLFVPIKSVLTNIIEFHFPKFNYKQSEIETYAGEIAIRGIKENSNHWLNDVVEGIEVVSAFFHKNADVDAEKEKETETAEEPQNFHDYIESQVKAKYPDARMEIVSASELPMTEENDCEEDEISKELKASIELGKSKCVEYKPYGDALKGFAGLGGMKELKELLNDRIVGALKNPEQARQDFIEYGKRPPRGFLFYGPPGCGKTSIVEHLSTEAGVKLLKIETGSVGGTCVHETSIYIDSVFNYAESIATKDKPVIVLIDDADSLFTKRSDSARSSDIEELSTFLNRIQKAADNNVVVIAATNRYDIIDEAMRSRFEEQVYIGLPDFEARKAIVKMFMEQRTKGHNIANDDETLNKIAEKFDKFPIRAIKMISDKASITAMKDGRRDISVKDFEKIISENKNMQVKEENYKTNAEKKPMGFK